MNKIKIIIVKIQNCKTNSLKKTKDINNIVVTIDCRIIW
jgi:hypothetical protein